MPAKKTKQKEQAAPVSNKSNKVQKCLEWGKLMVDVAKVIAQVWQFIKDYL